MTHRLNALTHLYTLSATDPENLIDLSKNTRLRRLIIGPLGVGFKSITIPTILPSILANLSAAFLEEIRIGFYYTNVRHFKGQQSRSDLPNIEEALMSCRNLKKIIVHLTLRCGERDGWKPQVERRIRAQLSRLAENGVDMLVNITARMSWDTDSDSESSDDDDDDGGFM